MRALRVAGLVLFIALSAGGIAWLALRQPKRQSVLLSDGSRLTLLKVTYGTNHLCQYGTGWQEILYPMLPGSLKPNLSPRVMRFPTANNSLMVWIRRDGGAPSPGWPPAFFVATTDENSLESALRQNSSVWRTLPGASVGKAAPPNSEISGWVLEAFPRREQQFRVRIYRENPAGKVPLAGDFLVQNPAPSEAAKWSGESLPATRQTNELEITLAQLETGLTGKDVGIGPAGLGAKSYSRATFKLKENGTPTEKWSLCRISARNAAGEIHANQSHSSRWWHGEHTVEFGDGLWLDEGAWQLDVDFARAADFSTDELWVVTGVRAPQAEEVVMDQTAVTRFGRELEFTGISGPNAKLPEGFTASRPHVNVHVRSPNPMDELRIVLVEVRDDQGRKAELKGSSTSASNGTGGPTPKQMLYGFSIELPKGAKTLDVTLAATPIRHAQFVAKPAMFTPPAKTAN